MSEKVNVLDTTYTINKIKEKDKFMIENNLCGYCDFYEKKIVVLASDTTSEKELIDWLAIQLPKINVLFEKAGVTS